MTRYYVLRVPDEERIVERLIKASLALLMIGVAGCAGASQ